MSCITVDQDKCKKDGLCVADCPLGVLRREKDGGPATYPGISEELCIDCGHCVAVCPYGALDQRSMRADQCLPLRKDLMPSPEQVEQLMLSRRSIRQYKPEPVERQKLQKLIELARYAPSGHNVQPLAWIVLTNPDDVRRCSELVIDWMEELVAQKSKMAELLHMDFVIKVWRKGVDRILRGAPHLVMAHASKNERTALAAAVGAVSYLELAAPVLGLGSCWAGYLHLAAQEYDPLRQHIGIPEENTSYGAVMLGYPAARYYRIPLRKEPDITWR